MLWQYSQNQFHMFILYCNSRGVLDRVEYLAADPQRRPTVLEDQRPHRGEMHISALSYASNESDCFFAVP